MNDATNDTTRTAADRVRFYVLQRMEMKGLDPEVLHALHTGTEREAELRTSDLLALLNDLERLAGPPCDYPPCKGARAIEHAEKFSYVAWKAYVDLKPTGHAVVVDGQPQTHPDWPAGEAFLRERGK